MLVVFLVTRRLLLRSLSRACLHAFCPHVNNTLSNLVNANPPFALMSDSPRKSCGHPKFCKVSFKSGSGANMQRLPVHFVLWH
ncbi:hypothetical protein EDD17DRAFT_1082602 [Pisolithus thermaeus]|nr:hypothetical protein EDD17DRAFT_1082602 [Pisolithus thermaeus]